MRKHCVAQLLSHQHMKCVSEKRGDLRKVEVSMLGVNILKDILEWDVIEIKCVICDIWAIEYSIIHPLPPQVQHLN